MSTDPEHQPISAAEADAALACLAGFEALLIAVSGGPDSLALLHLVAEWRVRHGDGPELSVATVDHHLRTELAAEAAFVAGQCADLQVPHATLHWNDQKPEAGLADAARMARYALLEARARAVAHQQSMAVVTAHTEDDQAETLVMRLKRGAGVVGLAAIPAARPIAQGSPIQLVRPLLAFPKTRLIATLEVRGITWCNDPSNADTAYERVRVRGALAAFRTAGIEAPALAKTARRMQQAREGLDYGLARFKDTLDLTFNVGVYAHLDRRAFDAGPSVLRQMLVAELIAQFGGRTAKPEVSEIELLCGRIAELSSGKSSGEMAATLGGAYISVGSRNIRVWREAGRLSEPDLILTPGHRYSWDDRFWVSCTGDPGTSLTVKVLGRAGYETIRNDVAAGHNLPAGAAYGVPAFWADATLFAVPALGFESEAGRRRSGVRLTSDPICLPDRV